MIHTPSPLNIWLFTDNKPGHKNQLEGLLKGIEKITPVSANWIDISKAEHSFFTIAQQLHKSKKQIDWCIGAGHKTHIFLLLGKLLANARSIVLMKPSFPLSWFDLVIIPEHDGHFPSANVIQSTGVINKIQPSNKHNKHKGLFLIGGPSKHYGWDNEDIIKQIENISQQQPKIHWQLTTSRRTPADFIQQLQNKNLHIQIIPHTETDSQWLPEVLATAGQVWVSADSVSMLYEALTSGAQVGLLNVPNLQTSRVQQGIDKLLDSKKIVDFNQWRSDPAMPENNSPLNEAERIAHLILQHFNNES